MAATPTLCVIIPTYQAEAHMGALLEQLHGIDRIVVADGSSDDGTVKVALKSRALLALGAKGRGPQLALGGTWHDAADWLLFLHADNRLSDDWAEAVHQHIADYPDKAAYFRYRADAKGFWARFMDFWVAMRCFWWRLPYGDQGLLIRRDIYDSLGGYANMVLFEDVEMIDRIKSQYGRSALKPLPVHIRINVDKYQRDGFWRRGWRNFGLLRAYRRGVPVAELQRQYHG